MSRRYKGMPTPDWLPLAAVLVLLLAVVIAPARSFWPSARAATSGQGG
jgi:hypothetical protein